MKKFLSVLLMSVLLVTTLAVFAVADDESEVRVYTYVGGTDESNMTTDGGNADVIAVPDGEEPSVTNTDVACEEAVSAENGTDVTIVSKPADAYETDSVNAYWMKTSDSGATKEVITLTPLADVSDTWTFTMVDHQVFVDILFKVKRPQESPTPAPAKTPTSNQWGDAELNPTATPDSDSDPTNILPPSPAHNSNEEEAPQEPQRAFAVPAEAPKSVLPANTVTFGSGSALASTGAAYNRLNNLTKNNAEKFSATVLSLEAKDLSNQNGLATYYAAIEGKEADILATYGVYASKDLSAEDNGKLTSLTWKNITAEKLDKNTRIKAVCYNLIDGTYTIEGEIDEFGNIILKDFIIRPTKTNITVFICK